MKSKKHRYLLLLTVVLVWGLSWPLNKLGLDYIPPYWFAACRLIVGTFFMFLLTIFMKKLIIPTIKDLPLIVIIGTLQIGLFILFINLGLATEPSGTGAILVYTTPLWVMPLAIFFFKESNSPFKWLGFILGIIGLLFMLNPWAIDWTNHGTLVGISFLMGASFVSAISILSARYMTWYHTPLELIPWQLLIGCIMLVTVAFIKLPNPTFEWNIVSIGCLGYTAIFSTALGFLGMTLLSKELPSTLTSMGFLGVPVSGAIFSVIILHESFSLCNQVAVLLIISGLICVVYGEKKSGSLR